MSDVPTILAVSIMPASWKVVCRWASRSSRLIYHFWLLKHHHPAATHHHLRHCEMQLSSPWKLHACTANNHYFLYIYLYICYMYLVLFSIILYRTIVTVCTDNIILHNYLPQMHQIIHLSPVGCFSPARGKREDCRVNRNLLTSFPTQIHALLSSLKLCTAFIIFLQLHTLLASGTFRADRPYHMTLRATSEC